MFQFGESALIDRLDELGLDLLHIRVLMQDCIITGKQILLRNLLSDLRLRRSVVLDPRGEIQRIVLTLRVNWLRMVHRLVQCMILTQ